MQEPETRPGGGKETERDCPTEVPGSRRRPLSLSCSLLVSALPRQPCLHPSPMLVPVALLAWGPWRKGMLVMRHPTPERVLGTPTLPQPLWQGTGWGQDCGLLPTRPWFNKEAALQKRGAGFKDVHRCPGPAWWEPLPYRQRWTSLERCGSQGSGPPGGRGVSEVHQH